jgi:hypothetical protein
MIVVCLNYQLHLCIGRLNQIKGPHDWQVLGSKSLTLAAIKYYNIDGHLSLLLRGRALVLDTCYNRDVFNKLRQNRHTHGLYGWLDDLAPLPLADKPLFNTEDLLFFSDGLIVNYKIWYKEQLLIALNNKLQFIKVLFKTNKSYYISRSTSKPHLEDVKSLFIKAGYTAELIPLDAEVIKLSIDW